MRAVRAVSDWLEWECVGRDEVYVVSCATHGDERRTYSVLYAAQCVAVVCNVTPTTAMAAATDAFVQTSARDSSEPSSCVTEKTWSERSRKNAAK